MHDAYVRFSRRSSFPQAPASLHQSARLEQFGDSGHKYRPDGGGGSLLGRLRCDVDKAARGG
jgi:hypothetical protein